MPHIARFCMEIAISLTVFQIQILLNKFSDDLFLHMNLYWSSVQLLFVVNDDTYRRYVFRPFQKEYFWICTLDDFHIFVRNIF